jgi:hypothetical protein
MQKKVWSKEETADEVPLNQWHEIKCEMIGTSSGHGKIFIHVAPGFQGNLYIDDVEIVWGGPTPVEKAIDLAMDACKATHSEHTTKMRVNLLDARDLQAVDWGGASDPCVRASEASAKTRSWALYGRAHQGAQSLSASGASAKTRVLGSLRASTPGSAKTR